MKPDILVSGSVTARWIMASPAWLLIQVWFAQEYGNRVKTDRQDSRKLAPLLAKGMLKRAWVPNEEELYHRQSIRRRRQLASRVRTQSRIKAELRFYGVYLAEPRGRWIACSFKRSM